MPDGSGRFKLGKQSLIHYIGTSTFSDYTVVPEIALAKIREDAPFEKVCYIGRGVSTSIGAVINNARVEPGANPVVFGLGGIGLNVIQGARMLGANMIVGVDTNPDKAPVAENFAITHVVNPKDVERDLAAFLDNLTVGRAGYSSRIHRQREHDAAGAGVLPQGLGRKRYHRRCRRGTGNIHPAVSAGDRARMARHRLLRWA